MRGERDIAVFVDLGDEGESPLYWIVPAQIAHMSANQRPDNRDHGRRWVPGPPGPCPDAARCFRLTGDVRLRRAAGGYSSRPESQAPWHSSYMQHRANQELSAGRDQAEAARTTALEAQRSRIDALAPILDFRVD